MTKIYGASDDLIEFEGDFSGEVGCYGTDETDEGVLIVVSDGTILSARYGKDGNACWGIKLIKAGDLFDKIEPCIDEDSDSYSDSAIFNDGVKWAFASTSWERVS